MHYVPLTFIHTADAYIKEIRFDGGDVTLRLLDYAEQLRDFQFHDVLAFRWGYDTLDDEPNARSDTAYELVDSPWLKKYAAQQSLPSEEFVHYKLCFNACEGDLDLLARRSGPCRFCGTSLE